VTAAVVLAAGFGTRLGPTTGAVPKPLLHVGGSAVATHLMRALGTLPSIDEVVVVINGRHPDEFERWRAGLGDLSHPRLVNTGARSVEERRGAVADLRAAMASFAAPADRWLVVAGDNLVHANDIRALDLQGEAGHDAVLCRDVGLDPTGSFGELTLDDDRRIVTFREKPADRTSPIAATCTYALSAHAPALLDTYLDEGRDCDSTGRFIAWLCARRPVYGLRLTEPYHDIGTPETLAAARLAFDSAQDAAP